MGTVGRRRLLGVVVLVLLFAIPWLLVSRPFGGGDDRETAGTGRRAAGADAARPAGTPEASVPGVETAEVLASDVPALPPPVDLESVDRERDLHGVVVDDEGKPVAGAALEVERTRPGRGYGDRPHLVPQPEPMRALSAEDGTFRFRLDWGEQVDLQVRAEGFGEGTLYCCPAGARLRVALSRARATVEVVVRDGQGNAIPGAEVSIGGSSVRPGLMADRKGTTDPQGRFLAEGLSPGRASIVIKHPEFGESGWVGTDLLGAERTRVEIVLDRGRTVEGRVVEAATRLPVAGARVGRGWTLLRAVQTDAEGRFSFRGWNDVPGWNFGDLNCLAAGFARGHSPVPEEGPVEFRLERGFHAEGRILDAGGKPVAGAVIDAHGYTERGPGGTRENLDTLRATTGGDGRWALPDLRRDLSYEIAVETSAHARLEFPLAPPPQGTDRVDTGDIALFDGVPVEGAVLDAAGNPVKGVEVSIDAEGNVRVDDRGRFRIARAAPGERKVYVVRPDAYVLLEKEVSIPAAGGLQDLVLRLQSFGKIVVRVVDTEDRALPGVEVYAYGEEEVDWTTTDAAGIAVLDQIKEEVVDVSAELNAPGNRAILLRAYLEKVRPAGQEIRVVLEEGVTVTGTVFGADGKPLPSANVWAACEGQEDDWYYDRTGESGEFEVLVPKGRFFDLTSQRADADGKVLEKGVVRQVSGPRAGLEIRLEPVKE